MSKNSFFVNFSHWLKRPSCKCCTNNPEYRCQWVFYKTLERKMGQWAQQLKAWVCTQKDLLIPAEKKRICWTFNKIPSVQTTNNRTIQLRVTANLPSPSQPEQPPEVPRGDNIPLRLQRPLRYASVLLLTSRQFNCVHMAPGQETVVSKSIIVRRWPETSRYSIVDLSYTEDQLF